MRIGITIITGTNNGSAASWFCYCLEIRRRMGISKTFWWLGCQLMRSGVTTSTGIGIGIGSNSVSAAG